MKIRSKVLIFGGSTAIIIFFAIAIAQVSIFVIQPLNALPDGKTLIIGRMNKMNFIDSADGMCARELGGVSLLCRLSVLGAVLDKASIYLRLPYIPFLYRISTGGEEYSK
jgi:hypothetical protein